MTQKTSTTIVMRYLYYFTFIMYIVDLQQNKDFLKFDQLSKMFSYSIPSQTCIVLQFYGNRVHKDQFEGISGGSEFGQNVVPMNNHIIFRQDTVYLYPSPLYSTALGNSLFS